MTQPTSAYPTEADVAAWWHLDPIAAELERQSRTHRYHPPEVFANVTRWLMHYFADVGLTEDEAILLVYNFSFQLDKERIAQPITQTLFAASAVLKRR